MNPTIRSAGSSRGRAGFSMLELMVSLSVFVLVAGAVVTTLTASTALNSTNRETILATHAAESALETLKGTAFDQVFARYNATAADDPVGPDPSPGAVFAVNGLSVQKDDGDGFAGEILFPGDGIQLLENVDDLELGMPRDLNGDGIDAADHAGNYRILPVRVVVQWRGRTGERRIELVTVLSEL